MTFRSKPQYLSPVMNDIEWDTFLLFERVYRIDYDLNIKHWTAYPFTESLDRQVKPVVIVEEQNFNLLQHFFKQDILTYI
jgi:hypothetical protein